MEGRAQWEGGRGRRPGMWWRGDQRRKSGSERSGGGRLPQPRTRTRPGTETRQDEMWRRQQSAVE